MRIAHLSDIHLIAPASASLGRRYALRTRAVAMGRTPDPALRAGKLAAALALAKAARPDHVVLSGDLTELGADAELELFAEVLGAAGFDPDTVTLVPGNHDAYSSVRPWLRAVRGPFDAWAKTSARPSDALPLAVLARAPAVFVPIDVTRHQPVLLSSGHLSRETLEGIERVARDPAFADVAIVVVLHHPPFPKVENSVARWVDSLHGSEALLALMQRHPNLHLLHGHHHRHVDRPRIFGAPGVADDPTGTPRVRFYDVLGTSLVPVTAAPSPR